MLGRKPAPMIVVRMNGVPLLFNVYEYGGRPQCANCVDKMRRGLMGDWKEVGDGVFELRLDFGPGYRVYYGKYGKVVIVLLGGGQKNGQQKNIAEAKRLWGNLKNEIKQI